MMGPCFNFVEALKNLILHLWLQSSAPKLPMEFTGGFYVVVPTMSSMLFVTAWHGCWIRLQLRGHSQDRCSRAHELLYCAVFVDFQ